MDINLKHSDIMEGFDDEFNLSLLAQRPGMDGESFYVPGWDSIPLEIKIGLQPFSNTWSMFSQYFRSSGEKTKSRSRICKPSELVLIGEEISRNVNVSLIAQMADIGFKVVLLERLNQKRKQSHIQNPCNKSKNQGGDHV